MPPLSLSNSALLLRCPTYMHAHEKNGALVSKQPHFLLKMRVDQSGNSTRLYEHVGNGTFVYILLVCACGLIQSI